MLQFFILLIVIAFVAGALGFTGIAAGAAGLAKIVFFLMVAGLAIMLVLALFGAIVLF
jgi:uncharacterized membrane protein YtjA (UPF0391 family)